MRKTQLVVSQRVRLHDGGRGIELGERPVPAEVRRLDSTVHFGRAVACLVRFCRRTVRWQLCCKTGHEFESSVCYRIYQGIPAGAGVKK